MVMSRHIVWLGVLGLGLSLTSKSQADIPVPKRTEVAPVKNEVVKVTIEVDEKAKEARIVMPRFVPGVLNPPKAIPTPPPSQVELDDGEIPAVAENELTPNNRLLFSGIALSLSIGCGGMWLVRKKGKGPLGSLALLLAVGGLLTVGAAVWGNGGPPPFLFQPKVPTYPSAWEGKATVSYQNFAPGSQVVRVILDKESFEKLKKAELKSAATGLAP
jgi:hypothetical protein